MARSRRGSRTPPAPNIESHPYNEFIIPQMRVAKWELQFLRDNMPYPELLDMPIHGWMHILHMLVYASQLCNYSLFDMEVVRWAILTHDSGHYHDDIAEPRHQLMSAYIAASMIKKVNADKANVVDAVKLVNIVGNHSRNGPSAFIEESVLRAADRLDNWRLLDFPGIDAKLMDAPGWKKVEKKALQLRRGD